MLQLVFNSGLKLQLRHRERKPIDTVVRSVSHRQSRISAATKVEVSFDQRHIRCR